MKILVASGIVRPEFGGPATYLEGLLPELRARGHDVSVLSYGEPQRGAAADGVTRVPRGPLLLRLARYASTYVRGAARADLVLVLSLALPRLGRKRSPVALRVAGDYAWERAVNRGWVAAQETLAAFQANRHGWRVEAAKAWRTAEARRADLVLAPSEYVREMVLAWRVDPHRVTVVPNAVRPDPDAAALPQLEARRLLGWKADHRYLLAGARLTRWKGVDFLIDAVADLADVHLVVAGDGPAAEGLAAHARERGARTTFCGALTRPELALRLRAADYLVLYSAYEGLSHTLLEALALGTPVIASQCGGNGEVVYDGINGLLVPYPDREALAVALRHACIPGVRQQLAAASATGLERFDWRHFVGRTCTALESLAYGSGSGRDRSAAALRSARP